MVVESLSPPPDDPARKIAAAVPHPGLVGSLETRLKQMTPASEHGEAMALALATQKNANLIKKALEKHPHLPAALVDYLPYLLDRVFGARLGTDLGDWTAWMRAAG